MPATQPSPSEARRRRRSPVRAGDAAATRGGELRLAAVAAAIAEPARARMLCHLLDGRARTATELATLALVSASTASVHLQRLREGALVEKSAQGKHRYFRLAGGDVAAALEGLLVVAGVPRQRFEPTTPPGLRAARTCYDHLAGRLAVQLHDRLLSMRHLARDGDGYGLTRGGLAALERVGVDVAAVQARRRRFACACMDWSERQPHLGGALGAALLDLAETRGWVRRQLDSRALRVTPQGERRFAEAFGIVPTASAGEP